MQEAIRNRHEKVKYYQNNQKNKSSINALFEYLPSLQEFEKHSEVCEKLHGLC